MEMNCRNIVDLVSIYYFYFLSEDEDIEGVFFNELFFQQVFFDYQIQQMIVNFVDQFGFNDEEFVDQDDNINVLFDRIVEINFNIDVDEDSFSVVLFEVCCSDCIQFFDDDEDEDIWEDSDICCVVWVMVRFRFGVFYVLESCLKNGLECGGQDGKVSLEVYRDVFGVGVLLVFGKKEVFFVEGDLEGVMWMVVFDELVNLMFIVLGVVRDVGFSVWVVGILVLEEKGWVKFIDF